MARAFDLYLVQLGLQLNVAFVNGVVALVKGENVVDVFVAIVGAVVVLIFGAEAVIV